MKITLFELISKEAKTLGIHCRSGYAAELAAMKRTYPMVLFIPPDPKEFEGTVGDVLITYSCTAYFMCPDKKGATDIERENEWLNMELLAFKFIGNIADSGCVNSVTNVSGGRDKYSLTPDGELSVKLTFNVKMPICNE